MIVHLLPLVSETFLLKVASKMDRTCGLSRGSRKLRRGVEASPQGAQRPTRASNSLLAVALVAALSLFTDASASASSVVAGGIGRINNLLPPTSQGSRLLQTLAMRHPARYDRALRLKGGSIYDTSSEDEKEEPEWIEEEGMFKLGDFLFHSPVGFLFCSDASRAKRLRAARFAHVGHVLCIIAVR